MKSKSNMLNVLTTAVVILAATSFVRADNASSSATLAPAGPNQTTSTTLKEAGVKPVQKFEITYFGIYNGPSIGAPGYSAQINPDPSKPKYGQVDYGSWPQQLQSQIKPAYNIDEHFFIGPIIIFNNYPGAIGNSMMQDSGVRVGGKNLIDSGGFSLAAEARLYAPIAASTVADNGTAYPELRESLKYNFPSSQWSIGLLNINKYHTYSIANADAKHLDADLYFGPNTNWQFTQKLAATLWVEFYPVHRTNADGSGWGLGQPFDVNPGINWDITDNFSVNPGLVFYPSNPDMSATSAIVYISGKLL